MKRYISVIFLALCSVAALAQPKIRVAEPRHDFGTIREVDGLVAHVFEIENCSTEPVVILDVVTSCGCTVPAFSRKPLPVGGKAEIRVEFNPENRPGIFEKDLAIYTSDRRKAATLTICGTVVGRTKSLEELYPVDAGGGLRLSSTLVAFTYVYAGARMHSSVGYANTSALPVRIGLQPVAESGILEIHNPTLVAAGECGEINFAYENPVSAPRYGTLSDALEVTVNGRGSGTMILVHGIGVDNPAHMKNDLAPKGEISENIIKFGAVKRKGGVRRRKFVLSNGGSGDMTVRAVEHGKAIRTTLDAGMSIAPGGLLDVTVTFDPSECGFGISTDHIMIVTNDPDRPMRRVRVTAIVEE